MKEIQLTQGKVALVDDEDFERVNAFKWNVTKSRNTFYAKRNVSIGNGKQTTIRLHRFILNITDKNIIVDHKDHNGLNCQKYNLRECDLFGNAQNQIKSHTRKFNSNYKGVYPSKYNNYISCITANNKFIYLGVFATEIEAAKAYNEAALLHHGEFASLNDI